MSLAARLKMFEQAATDNGASARPGSAAAPAKRPTWGASRGPSLAEQIKKVRAAFLCITLCCVHVHPCGCKHDHMHGCCCLQSTQTPQVVVRHCGHLQVQKYNVLSITGRLLHNTGVHCLLDH